MAIPNYYYFYILIITCVVLLLAAQIRASDDNAAAGSLLGGKKLIIGVPKKPTSGFVQFVDLQLNSSNKIQVVTATGYSIDVFYAVISYLERLRYNISFEFRAFVDKDGQSSGDYDALVYQIYEGRENEFHLVITRTYNEQYDAVVGDLAIVANRSNYVDFTLPYKPGVMMMLVKVRRDPRLNMWIFVQPFTWDLWLCIVAFSISIGGIIVLMVRCVDEDSTPENNPTPRRQLGWTSFIWLPLMQAVLPEGELVAKAWSRFVLVLWLILVFVLMQSYTACLSSILTVHQLQPTYPSENDVLNDPNVNIGYPDVSFLRGLLVDHLKIDSGRLKNYTGFKEYKEALDKGSRQGGVDAIFNEFSYLKIFLNEYGYDDYALVVTTHRLDGYGYAFPKGSNLTSYFSGAILNVRESEEMDLLEQKYFGSNEILNEGKDLSNALSDNNASPSLTAYSFAGLFIVIGALSVLALLISLRHVWLKFIILAKTYSQQFLSHSFRRLGSMIESFFSYRGSVY